MGYTRCSKSGTFQIGLLHLTLTILVLACSRHPASWRDPSVHTVHFVTLALQYSLKLSPRSPRNLSVSAIQGVARKTSPNLPSLNLEFASPSSITSPATISPSAGPCLNPCPEPPPTSQTPSCRGCRSTTKSPSAVCSYWHTLPLISGAPFIPGNRNSTYSRASRNRSSLTTRSPDVGLNSG